MQRSAERKPDDETDPPRCCPRGGDGAVMGITPEPAVPAPSVFVIDYPERQREALRQMLASAGLRVHTYTGVEFLRAYDGRRPACLVQDVRMPGPSGLYLQQALAVRRIDVPIIMVTGCGDVPTAVQALKWGAFDFIERPFSDELLLKRIDGCLGVELGAYRIAAERAQFAARLARLSAREREVMDLVIAGKTNKRIATDLGISERTVEIHRGRVMFKMEVESLAALVRVALLVCTEPADGPRVLLPEPSAPDRRHASTAIAVGGGGRRIAAGHDRRGTWPEHEGNHRPFTKWVPRRTDGHGGHRENR